MTPMRPTRLYPVAAVLFVATLVLGSFPVDAQTGQFGPRATSTPLATPTPPPPTPIVPPQAPVVNNDPRFGVVQAIFNPQLALNAGARWERLIFPWNQIQPNGPNDFDQGWFTEEQLNSQLARGIQIVGITLYTPNWAARDPRHE